MPAAIMYKQPNPLINTGGRLTECYPKVTGWAPMPQEERGDQSVPGGPFIQLKFPCPSLLFSNGYTVLLR